MRILVFAVLVVCSALGCQSSRSSSASQPSSDNAALWYYTAHTEIEQKLRGYGSGDYDSYWNILTSAHPDYFEPEKAGPLMAYLQPRLGWIRHGAMLEDCVWANEFWAKPAYQSSPQWGMLRDLCRVMVVNAMVRREQGDLAGSTDDLLVALQMSRHSAAEHTVLPLLNQFYMDRFPRETLAAQLGRYDRAGLERLRGRLSSLRPLVPMSASVDAEYKAFRWFTEVYETQGVAGFTQEFNELYDASQMLYSLSSKLQLREQEEVYYASALAEKQDGKIRNASAKQIELWLKEVDAMYDQAHDVVRATPEQLPKLVKDCSSQFDSPNPVMRLLGPAFAYYRKAELTHWSRRGMLDAMIAYRLGGEDAFNKIVDPWDGKPYDRELAEEGLVVSSRMPEEMVGSQWPLQMVFSKTCATPLVD